MIITTKKKVGIFIVLGIIFFLFIHFKIQSRIEKDTLNLLIVIPTALMATVWFGGLTVIIIEKPSSRWITIILLIITILIFWTILNGICCVS